MQKDVKDIYGFLSKKYGISRQAIIVMCNHPFIFASRRMADPDDEKSLMFHYLFKLKLKKHIVGKKRILYDSRKNKNKQGDDVGGNESV